MREKTVFFPCGKLSLQGLWHFSQGEGSSACVIVCHPHPLYGGDMYSNVVASICQSLSGISISSLRFNFRGVGRSQGVFSQGVGEQEDVKAALAYVLTQKGVSSEKIGIVGYSFGAIVATPVALEGEAVKALVLISPPLSSQHWEKLMGCSKPKLLICGKQDSFISAEELLRLASRLPPPREYEIFPEDDHFWWGHEERLSQRVTAFFAAVFQ